MPSVLIVGATRGLGAALVTYYASDAFPGASWTVYATSRAPSPPAAEWAHRHNVKWLTDIDLEKGPEAAHRLAEQIQVQAQGHEDGTDGKLNTVIVTAGYFATEQYGQSKWDEEVKMYTLSSVAPVFVVEALDQAGLFLEPVSRTATGTKVILVSSESGSITLRHEQEGGGNYGHHGSKAALNMTAKQLSFDLRPKGVAVCAVHPSFMRTDMTKGVGFDQFWDAGGALPPDEAAKILADWVEKDFTLQLAGTYWAPRGTRDIGNWDVVMGKDTAKKGPVELPW